MKVENTHSELIDLFINPDFLEAIKLSPNQINISTYISFDFERNGIPFDITIYNDEENQVIVSEKGKEYYSLGHVILRDHCKDINDLKKVFEKLDDYITRR